MIIQKRTRSWQKRHKVSKLETCLYQNWKFPIYQTFQICTFSEIVNNRGCFCWKQYFQSTLWQLSFWQSVAYFSKKKIWLFSRDFWIILIQIKKIPAVNVCSTPAVTQFTTLSPKFSEESLIFRHKSQLNAKKSVIVIKIKQFRYVLFFWES